MKVDKSPFHGKLTKIPEEAILAKLEDWTFQRKLKSSVKISQTYLATHPPVSKKKK